jgi:hypothetical protein
MLIQAFIMAALIGLSLQGKIYQQETGLKSFYYSAAAYCLYETLDNWNCGKPCAGRPGLKSFTRIHNKDKETFAYVGWNSADNEIVVAFRGTNSA